MDKNTGYTIFETFVGAGGSHLGFMHENYKTVYVNDFEENCLKTLVSNNENLIKENAFIDNRSIWDVDAKKLKKQLSVKPKEIDVMFGGVVCKGFSLAGERNPIDERSYLYKKQLELVAEFLPKISIIENVPGLLNAKILVTEDEELKDKINDLWQRLEDYKGKKANLRKTNSLNIEFEKLGSELRNSKSRVLQQINKSDDYISVLDDIKNTYAKLGYNVHVKVLNSAWYGAATKRERVIIVAIRKDVEDIFTFPEPTHMSKDIYKTWLPKSCLNLPNPVTVNQALSNINYKDKSDADNKPMNHNKKTIERFKYIPEGDNIANHMDKVPDDLKISSFYSRGATMRLDGKKPAPTLVPGHSNFPVHPKKHRSITVREAATITGFPVDYKFYGNHSKRCEYVGNAVPPKLAQAIARQCSLVLDNYYSGS